MIKSADRIDRPRPRGRRGRRRGGRHRHARAGRRLPRLLHRPLPRGPGRAEEPAPKPKRTRKREPVREPSAHGVSRGSARPGATVRPVKRRWYERNRRLRRRWRINRHAARAGSSSATRSRARCSRRSTPAGCAIGDATPCSSPAAGSRSGPEARDRDRRGLLPQPRDDARRGRADRDRRPRDVRQRLLRRRRRPPLRRPDVPITWQGFIPRGPVRIGSNVWFGVNCVVTGGVEIGDRAVIGANSVVTQGHPAGADRRGRAGEGAPRDRVPARERRVGSRPCAEHFQPRSLCLLIGRARCLRGEGRVRRGRPERRRRPPRARPTATDGGTPIGPATPTPAMASRAPEELVGGSDGRGGGRRRPGRGVRGAASRPRTWRRAYGDEQGCRAAVAAQGSFDVNDEEIEIEALARVSGGEALLGPQRRREADSALGASRAPSGRWTFCARTPRRALKTSPPARSRCARAGGRRSRSGRAAARSRAQGFRRVTGTTSDGPITVARWCAWELESWFSRLCS